MRFHHHLLQLVPLEPSIATHDSLCVPGRQDGTSCYPRILEAFFGMPLQTTTLLRIHSSIQYPLSPRDVSTRKNVSASRMSPSRCPRLGVVQSAPSEERHFPFSHSRSRTAIYNQLRVALEAHHSPSRQEDGTQEEDRRQEGNQEDYGSRYAIERASSSRHD